MNKPVTSDVTSVEVECVQEQTDDEVNAPYNVPDKTAPRSEKLKMYLSQSVKIERTSANKTHIIS